MLSKFDIQKELGKRICLFPLNLDNIKENSINLCTGDFAWSMSTGQVFLAEKVKDKNRRFSLIKDNEHCVSVTVEKGKSAIINGQTGEKYILILPLSTTLIETKEVLALGPNIGGTYHSKVGLVTKGLGHIGTMVGPNFSGDSLIAVHNSTKELVVLSVGESFVSVVFHYLDTPFTYSNPTTSGHTDKFSALGLDVSEAQLNELNQDWKKKFEEVQKRMCQTSDFLKLQNELKVQKWKSVKKFFCKMNLLIILIAMVLFGSIYALAYYLDQKSGQNVWVERYFNVGFSGIFVTILTLFINTLKDNAQG